MVQRGGGGGPRQVASKVWGGEASVRSLSRKWETGKAGKAGGAGGLGRAEAVGNGTDSPVWLASSAGVSGKADILGDYEMQCERSLVCWSDRQMSERADSEHVIPCRERPSSRRWLGKGEWEERSGNLWAHGFARHTRLASALVSGWILRCRRSTGWCGVERAHLVDKSPNSRTRWWVRQ